MNEKTTIQAFSGIKPDPVSKMANASVAEGRKEGERERERERGRGRGRKEKERKEGRKERLSWEDPGLKGWEEK
jgi:hypothetical protein